MDIVALAEKICKLVFTLIMAISNIVTAASGKGSYYDAEDFSLIAG